MRQGLSQRDVDPDLPTTPYLDDVASTRELPSIPVPAEPRATSGPPMVFYAGLGTLVVFAVMFRAFLIAPPVEPKGSSPVFVAPLPPLPRSNEPVALPAVPLPVAAVPALPAPVSTTGILVTPSAGAHRIYVDGRMLGIGGARISVRCGARDVRVGSAGELATVDVPCGGEVVVR